MLQPTHCVALAIYRHRSNPERHVTLLVIGSEQHPKYQVLALDVSREEPDCQEGSREEVLEQWRRLNRELQGEWFLHGPMLHRQSDFDEFI